MGTFWAIVIGSVVGVGCGLPMALVLFLVARLVERERLRRAFSAYWRLRP